MNQVLRACQLRTWWKTETNCNEITCCLVLSVDTEKLCKTPWTCITTRYACKQWPVNLVRAVSKSEVQQTNFETRHISEGSKSTSLQWNPFIRPFIGGCNLQLHFKTWPPPFPSQIPLPVEFWLHDLTVEPSHGTNARSSGSPAPQKLTSSRLFQFHGCQSKSSSRLESNLTELDDFWVIIWFVCVCVNHIIRFMSCSHNIRRVTWVMTNMRLIRSCSISDAVFWKAARASTPSFGSVLKRSIFCRVERNTLEINHSYNIDTTSSMKQ